MLNIPEVVKALFKTDSVRKNFRVHFPDGEYRDLVNSDIVADSVKFTESVCSKTVLQFGLAEASRIEFECVGVPNIYGATIECYCEIDATSLDAEYQTVKSDVDYPVYSIPYGTFTVQSCPRSAGAMSHRRVEAYSIVKPGTDYIEQAVAYESFASAMNVNLVALAIGTSNDDLGVIQEDADITPSLSSYSYSIGWWSDDSETHYMALEIQSASGYQVINPTFYVARMTCSFDGTGIDEVYSDILQYGASDSIVEEAKAMLQPSYAFYLGASSPPERHAFANPNDSGYMPYMSSHQIMLTIPSEVTVILRDGDTVINTYTFTNMVSNASMKTYSLINSSLEKVNATFEPTYTSEARRHTYINSANLAEIYEGTLELFGMFGFSDRNGGNKSIYLSKSSPIALLPGLYSEMWWDEFDISPIGSVKLTYKDVDIDKEQTIIYSFGGGLSEYDMTSNYILKNLNISASDLTNQTLEEYVTGLIDTFFIPNIGDIAFTPVDLSAIGLPYLEAGDYLEIDAGDGTTVGTYILSRTLSGEQYLTDDIQSQGGEIIGSTVRSA